MNTAFGHFELLNTTVTAWHCLPGSDSTMAVHSTLFSGDGVTSRTTLGPLLLSNPCSPCDTPAVGPVKCTSQSPVSFLRLTGGPNELSNYQLYLPSLSRKLINKKLKNKDKKKRYEIHYTLYSQSDN